MIPSDKLTLPAPADAPMPVRLLKKGTALFQPDIWIVDVDGSPRVWKTWGRRSRLERATLSTFLARREACVIATLQDVEGFPTLLSMPHPWTIEMSLLDAKPIPVGRAGDGLLEPEYFDRLWAMVATMHARGINHGDLRRKNLLCALGDPRSPRLVDFTQCLYFPPPQGWLTGRLLREALRVDRAKFLKLKVWYLGPEHMTAQELEEVEQIPWHLKLGRFLRRKVYRPLFGGRRKRKRAKNLAE